MPKFLTQPELYRLMQRELPEFVYPDGAPSDYNSTAEADSVAAIMKTAYETMSSIYDNLILATATYERLGSWETAYLGQSVTGELTDGERRANLMAFLTSGAELASYWSILTTCMQYVDEGVVVELRQRNSLGNVITGAIRGERLNEVWGPGWIAGDPAPSGVTVSDLLRNDQDELLATRREAYVFDLIIWGYDLPVALQEQLDILLTKAELSRCSHTVTLIPQRVYASSVEATRSNVERPVGPQAMLKDSTSGTGYRLPGAYYFGFDGDEWAEGFGDDSPTSQSTQIIRTPYFGFDGDTMATGFKDALNNNGGYFATVTLPGGYFFFVIS